MNSRRTRIKGVANIPQRKKNTNEADQIAKEERNEERIVVDTGAKCLTENILEKTNTDVNNQSVYIENIKKESPIVVSIKVDNIGKIKNESLTDVFLNSDNVEKINKESLIEVYLDNDNVEKVNKESLTKVSLNSDDIEEVNKETLIQPPLVSDNNHLSNQEVKESLQQSLTCIETKNKLNYQCGLPRRKLWKPNINLSNEKSLVSNRHAKEDVNNIIDIIAENKEPDNLPLHKTEANNIKHVQFEAHNNVSDLDYPIPPSSPSKFNRSRIKAVPRLSQRKTSFSASESEDESKKYGRIRNNSVCSVASTNCPESSTPYETVPPKEVIQVIPKKIIRTDQSKRLAEARKEFYKKFRSNNPEKNKLKMIDLIFYNPTTNPMSPKNVAQVSEERENDNLEDKNNSEQKNQENDDPVNKNDSENDVLVPQIKIGPFGEIILDERSLIVENTEIVKQKEKMLNSKLVDGNLDIGYGIYRKAGRSKGWSHKETLRFYKALNLIGTDFTVMAELFPKRSRRELKLKFTKEEKMNRHLIDKAIMQPCNYNFTDLKKEIQMEEEEEAAIQKLKESELEQKKKEKQFKRGRSRRKDNELAHTKSSDKLKTSDQNIEKSKNYKVSTPKKLKLKSLNINAVLQSDSDADISDLDTQSEEEEVALPILQPTRSGRMPKFTKRYSNLDEIEKPAKRGRLISLNSYPELSSDKLVPGSVVITAEEDCENTYKVYMVTPEKNLTPLDLDPLIVANLVKERQQTTDQDISANTIIENNFTIPANDQIQNDSSAENVGTYISL
ncbi:uncharacterized protein LOC115888925 isoform X2 [Sitophilus oryzae]|uniref:Uncharacterized protein LOC115888925 isoform X2 n=1 Tax=Sitophilus oryzae TaxID=7048 RepID=A0A6J2YN75_SITOR|nr:uncharacterized protein LOC115888925 isoform X2 [Sitophilus oryzae]